MSDLTTMDSDIEGRTVIVQMSMPNTERLARVILYGVIALWAFAFLATVASAFGYGRDATDGDSRSGMRLHTDAETGCQYLSTGDGLTPRMRNNHHMGCRNG